MAPYTYYAFISYKRQGEDQKWAEAIYNQLTSYDLNIYFKGTAEEIVEQEKINSADKTIKPLFKDTEQFTTGDILSEKIKSELQKSRKLIVICSERMRKEEKWIREEVEYFIKLGHGAKDILPIIIETEEDKAVPEKCFPSTLPKEWHAVSVRDHLLSQNDGFVINTLMHFDKSLKYRKTILSLIPPLFTIVKHTLQELWEMDRRRRETKFLIYTLGSSLLLVLLYVLLNGLYNERTRANEEKSMRMVETARSEMAEQNMQKAALLLTHANELKDGFMIGDYSDFAKNSIQTALADFYIASDTIREYAQIPMILLKSEDGNMLVGYREGDSVLFLLDKNNLAVIKTMELDSTISFMKLSKSGRYLFIEGVMDICIIDTEQLKIIFTKEKVFTSSGAKFGTSFACSVPHLCFSLSEKYAYYLNPYGNGKEPLERVELATGNIEKFPLEGFDGTTLLFTPVLTDNTILYATSSTTGIIDSDQKKKMILVDRKDGYIQKAALAGNNLMVIQKVNEKDSLYNVKVFDITTGNLKNSIPMISSRYKNFNACITQTDVIVIDNHQIAYYLIGSFSPRLTITTQLSGFIRNAIVDNEYLFFENEGTQYIYNLNDRLVVDTLKLPIDKKSLPIDSRFFSNSNYFFYTDYTDKTVVYRKTSNLVENDVLGKKLTGFIYSGTGNYYAHVIDFRHVKIYDNSSDALIREFDAPIWVLGCQSVVGRDEFIFRCNNEFAVYQPQKDTIWTSPVIEGYVSWRNNKNIKINSGSVSFVDNGYYGGMSSYDTYYAPLILSENWGAIGNCMVDFSNGTIKKKIDSCIPFSDFRYIVEDENKYRFVNDITNDTLPLKYVSKTLEVPHFSINADEKLILVTEYQDYAVWENFLFSFSGQKLGTYDLVNPQVLPAKRGFLIGSIAKCGLLHLKSDGKLDIISKQSAITGFILTPDKERVLFSGLSGFSYMIHINKRALVYKLPLSSWNINNNEVLYSKDQRYLYLEEMLLKGKNKYLYYDCIVDLKYGSVFMKWNRDINSHTNFSFIGTDKFMYITYKSDGTIKKITRGILDENFFFEYAKKFGKRKISKKELLEDGYE